MRYVKVLVVRNEHLAIGRDVPPWEIPVLNLIHGAEKIEELDEDTYVDRELPTAESEFERLAMRYGTNPATETPYSVMVFGQAPQGVAAIQKLMDESESIAANGKPEVPVVSAAVPKASAKVKTAKPKAKAKTVKAPVEQTAVVDSEDDDPTA